MLNTTSKVTMEDFWNDCIKNQLSNHEKININHKINKNVGENNLKKKNNNNAKYLLELYLKPDPSKNKKNNELNNKSKNQTVENQNLIKIFKNHPLIKEKIQFTQEEKENKKRQKTSLMRCLGLYAYGMEVKKEKLLTDQNINKEKLKDEILKCTFKPKINKYSSLKPSKFLNELNNKKTINNDNKINNNDNKDVKKKQILLKDDEYTFKPKLNKGTMKSIFDKSKSIEKDKLNEQFILRYDLAREFYMTKKIKQLSNKDDSYSTMLTEYNYFTSKHKKNKKINFCKTNLINIEANKNDKLIKKEDSIFQSLRNALLEINLSDEEKL